MEKHVPPRPLVWHATPLPAPLSVTEANIATHPKKAAVYLPQIVAHYEHRFRCHHSAYVMVDLSAGGSGNSIRPLVHLREHKCTRVHVNAHERGFLSHWPSWTPDMEGSLYKLSANRLNWTYNPIAQCAGVTLWLNSHDEACFLLNQLLKNLWFTPFSRRGLFKFINNSESFSIFFWISPAVH